MERLHIPLRSGHSTTRPVRRVVWQYLVFMVLLSACFYAAARSMISATHLTNAFPGAQTVIDLVGHRGIAEVALHTGDLPLLTKRPLTLNDLTPFIRGEVALAIYPDHTRAVAFKGGVDEITKARWKEIGVFVHEKEGYSFIFGESSVELGEMDRTWSLFAFLPSYAGRVLGNGEDGPIYLMQDGVDLTLTFDDTYSKKREDLALNTIAWIPFGALQIPQSLQTFFPSEALQGTGTLLVVKDDTGVAFQIDLDRALDSTILAEIIQKSALRVVPSTATLTLLDGTLVDELRSSTDTIKTSIVEDGDQVRLIAEVDGEVLIAEKTENHTKIRNRTADLYTLNDAEPLGNLCQKSSGALIVTSKLLESGLLTYTVYDPTFELVQFAKIINISGKSTRLCW